MNEQNVRNSIYYILRRASDLEFRIGKTMLIKLLYLLDIEHYQSHQRTFSELNWIFYKYGPYAFEIETFLSEIGIVTEQIPLKTGKVFASLGMESEEEPKLDIETKSTLEKLLEKWGTADLRELLDYVYFETEPMRRVEFNQKLDFARIKESKPEEEKVELSSATRQRLIELGKRISAQLEKIEPPKALLIELPPGRIGRSLFWDDEIFDITELKGKVHP